ncbi:MAG: hypothetical protein PHW58_07155 [Candidatus Methanofastidiosa archaeon]|nr:hypothetical protein [Candidatus Methanofastidiosa archaeon]
MRVEGKEQYEWELDELSIQVRKGESCDIAAHLATVLAARGIVEIPPLSSAQIRKMGREERASATLMQLPDDFYSLLAFTLAQTADEKEREKIRAAGKDLSLVRLEKLARLSLQGDRQGRIPLQGEERRYLAAHRQLAQTALRMMVPAAPAEDGVHGD